MLEQLTEEECEPTAVSVRIVDPTECNAPKVGEPCTVAPIAHLLQHKPQEDVIELLERMLTWARAGELIGVVAFGHHVGKETVEGQAGDTDFSAVLASFEDWKFRRAWRRNRTDDVDDQ